MPRSAPRSSSLLLLLVALVASVLLVPPHASAAGPTQLESAQAAAAKGRVRGYVAAPGRSTPPLKVAWFTTDWTYLGARSVSRSGAYSLELPEGTYRLQFTDKRPSYDVTKLAQTDATVVVRAGRTAIRNVRMQRGAAITGTVMAGGRAGSHATVIAASKDERSFSTTANGQGQFALGGLPAGSYSIFTYDRKKQYVGKSSYVSRLQAGKPRNVGIRLNQRSGGLLVDLYAGNEAINGTVMVTAVSRATGQFWTTKARGGTAVFKGVHPGRYDLVVGSYGDYLGRSGNVSHGVVRPGRTAFGSFRLTQRGGAFAGRLVASDDGTAVAKATVRVYETTGSIVAATTTAADGTFRVGGRLATTKGLSLVAFDGANMDLFDVLRLRGLAIRTNQTLDLGDVLLPAKPSASVVGYVADAYNRAIRLGGVEVQLVNAKNVVIASTTSGADGSFVMDKRLMAQGSVSVVVAPPAGTDYLGEPGARCQYVSSKRGGIVLEAGEQRDLGAVGIMRKAGGTCQAPVGDPVKY